MTLLEVRGLCVSVTAPEGKTTILDDLSFHVDEEEAVALVGESGSGKTLTAFAVMRLLPQGADIDRGAIVFEGKDLTKLRERELDDLRGARLAMVFQEPSAALNPVYTIGAQISEAIRLHERVSRRAARKLAETWLARVGMPTPAKAFDSYPHELSGGMKQRTLLAIALVAGPSLLIADEPTTSLDRTLEAQILAMIARERRERKMALLLVSHDLATTAEITDRVLVLYAGQLVEEGLTNDVLSRPKHPYTVGLVSSIPDPAVHPARTLGGPAPRLPVLRGAPPRFDALPKGCRFSPRCERSFDRCFSESPPLYEVDGRKVRCFLFDPDAAIHEADDAPDAVRAPSAEVS